MRIAIVINKAWNVYNFRRSLIKALQSLGYDIIAIAPRDEYSQKLEEEGCRFVHVPISSHGMNPIQDALLVRKLYHIYRDVKPDIILHYTIKPNIYGAIAARLAGIPSINNVTGLGTIFLHQNPVYKLAKLLYKFAFRFPYKVFFQNKDDLALFLQQGLVSKEKTEIVPGSGVDVNRFKPNTFVRNDPFTFLLIARVLYDKGIVEFIEAIRILKLLHTNIRFQLIGALDTESKMGIPENDLHAWVQEGLIEYIGFTDHVEHYYQKADCVVLPSYREGLPKALIEAMATSKPIITTDVPGCREVVVDGENGYICQPRDIYSLKNAMEKMLLLDSSTLQKMGEESRQIVLYKYAEVYVLNQYINVIKGLDAVSSN